MRSNKNIIGRMAMVRDTKTGHNHIVEAIVVDSTHVRLQTGEHFGEVRQRGEFEILEKISPHEREADIIGSVWPD
jgi:hypothetical protein